uniref:Uncharacterized protein n=1 Tax=Aureoumbra lagunensis TaxID=44058 RepID=A0A7S3NPX5_9STRA|mmetsp:Transcript_18982/g.28663  ORF Transcript_18982/g.28663 Transcript_18982/m.28663 type:complete len:625 (-) Transcript_18982:97-1971(-)
MDVSFAKKALKYLKSKALGFQKEGINFGLRCNGRMLIADEMGTGKSLQAICVALHYSQDMPALIVCPASLRFNWANELEKWLPDLSPCDISVAKNRADVEAVLRKKVAFVIVTYSLFTSGCKVAMACAQRAFQVIIIDESHYLRSKDSQRTKILIPLMKQAKRLILLSGTPSLARPVELYSQVSTLRPDLFGSYTEFTTRYCDAHRGHFGWDVSGNSNSDELNKKMQEFMIRRLKKDVLSQLPAKRRQLIAVEVSTNDKKTENAMSELAEASAILSEAINDELGSWQERCAKNAALMRAWQASGIAKISASSSFVGELLANGNQKVLVFGHHRAVLDGIEANLIRLNIKAKHIRIDGNTSPAERSRLVQQFQNDSQTQLGILSMTAAGEGLTLTAASIIVFAELHWTPGVLVQCEDRAHRIGQEHSSVNVYYLVIKDETKSLDCGLWRMIAKKVATVGHALDGNANASLQASDNDAVLDNTFSSFIRSELGSKGVIGSGSDFIPKNDIRSFFSSSITASATKRKSSTDTIAPPTTIIKRPRVSSLGSSRLPIDLSQPDSEIIEIDDDDYIPRPRRRLSLSSKSSSSEVIEILDDDEENCSIIELLDDDSDDDEVLVIEKAPSQL